MMNPKRNASRVACRTAEKMNLGGQREIARVVRAVQPVNFKFERTTRPAI